MENENKPEQTEQPKTYPPATSTFPAPVPKKSNFLSTYGKVALLLIAAFLLLGGGIYAGIMLTKNQNQNANITPAPTAYNQGEMGEKTPTPPTLKSFTTTAMEDLAFSAYTVSFPDSWAATEEIDEITQTLTITKNGYIISIYQAPQGGNFCIFEGELPEGPATDYRNSQYVEIDANFGTVRRIGNTTEFSFCQKSNTNADLYNIPTNIGNITYLLPSNYEETILSEMDQIISSITIE